MRLSRLIPMPDSAGACSLDHYYVYTCLFTHVFIYLFSYSKFRPMLLRKSLLTFKGKHKLLENANPSYKLLSTGIKA